VAFTLSKIKPSSQPGGRPPAAVELTAHGAIAAALPAAGGSLVYAFAPLASGSLVPGIEEPNFRSPEAVAEAIRSALGRVSPRSRAVTLVLPDTLVRVFVLEFDSLPPKSADAIQIIRFRLRKMVPFETEHAGVSYQILSQTKSECKVLTAVIPGPILAEYEAAVRAAGYEPGAVLPSSLAALETVQSMEAVLAINLTGSGITTIIANGQDLLLYRTLDLPADRSERDAEISRSISVAAAYYEDKLGAPARTLHYAANRATEEFTTSVIEPELTLVDLAPMPETGIMNSLGNESIAGVSGALVGAR
jgi:type IV pilus assembly protein PilM